MSVASYQSQEEQLRRASLEGWKTKGRVRWGSATRPPGKWAWAAALRWTWSPRSGACEKGRPWHPHREASALGSPARAGFRGGSGSMPGTTWCSATCATKHQLALPQALTARSARRHAQGQRFRTEPATTEFRALGPAVPPLAAPHQSWRRLWNGPASGRLHCAPTGRTEGLPREVQTGLLSEYPFVQMVCSRGVPRFRRKSADSHQAK